MMKRLSDYTEIDGNKYHFQGMFYSPQRFDGQDKAQLEVLAANLRNVLGGLTPGARLVEGDSKLIAMRDVQYHCDQYHCAQNASYHYLSVDNERHKIKLNYKDAVKTFAIDLLLGDHSSFAHSGLCQLYNISYARQDFNTTPQPQTCYRYDLGNSFDFSSTSVVFGKMNNQLKKSDVDLAFKQKMSLVEGYDNLQDKEQAKQSILQGVFSEINESRIALYVNKHAPVHMQLQLFASLMTRQHQVRMLLDNQYQKEVSDKCKKFGITQEKYLKLMQEHYVAAFRVGMYYTAYYGATNQQRDFPRILIKSTELTYDSNKREFDYQPHFAHSSRNGQNTQPSISDDDIKGYKSSLERARVVASLDVLNNERIRYIASAFVNTVLCLESFSINTARYFYPMYTRSLDTLSYAKDNLVNAFNCCRVKLHECVNYLSSIDYHALCKSNVEFLMHSVGTAFTNIGEYLKDLSQRQINQYNNRRQQEPRHSTDQAGREQSYYH